MTPDARSRAAADLDMLSRTLTRDAQTLVMFYESETDRELPALERQAEDMMWIALAIAYIIAIMSFAIARLTLAKVVRPIEQLANAAEAIAAGDLTARAPIGGDREVAQLGASFNRMADALSHSYAELRERARTDELTGLPNFRAFRDTIDAEIERASRYEYSVGVLVLDLDHFKKYNDAFGHLAGNDALQAASKAIRANVRVVDFPARYGGEEFAVVLPQIDPLSMHRVAERIRTGIETMPCAPERTRVTVSIGGAMFPSDGRTPEQLFKVADERLYEAKERGRNCTVVPEGVVA
jgi:diguanylate cyclase (GGDEF)-like protein